MTLTGNRSAFATPFARTSKTQDVQFWRSGVAKMQTASRSLCMPLQSAMLPSVCWWRFLGRPGIARSQDACFPKVSSTGCLVRKLLLSLRPTATQCWSLQPCECGSKWRRARRQFPLASCQMGSSCFLQWRPWQPFGRRANGIRGRRAQFSAFGLGSVYSRARQRPSHCQGSRSQGFRCQGCRFARWCAALGRNEESSSQGRRCIRLSCARSRDCASSAHSRGTVFCPQGASRLGESQSVANQCIAWLLWTSPRRTRLPSLCWGAPLLALTSLLHRLSKVIGGLPQVRSGSELSTRACPGRRRWYWVARPCLPSTRRNAAARRALKESLTFQPLGNFGSHRGSLFQQPRDCHASSHVRSVMAEHRSRVGSYPTVVHTAWSIAGALDCLRAGKPDQARARLNIALLMIDQMSVDKGSWILASELSLEVPPPMSSFRRREAHVSVTDPVYSRILDPRWAEIALGRLKDEAEFIEKRSRLAQRFSAGPPKREEGDDSAGPDVPPPKAKTRPPHRHKNENA